MQHYGNFEECQTQHRLPRTSLSYYILLIDVVLQNGGINHRECTKNEATIEGRVGQYHSVQPEVDKKTLDSAHGDLRGDTFDG